MRTKTISVSERQLMFVIGGQLFDQAPNRKPRKAETIMESVKLAFRKDAYNDNEYYSLEIEEGKLGGYLKNILMSIPEFEELNLSQIEFEQSISVDDDSRPKYSFTSRYDKHNSESWKSDFIDLDAFIRNVHNRLLIFREVEQDCFCCVHQEQGGVMDSGNSEVCKTCLVNPNLKYNFENARTPKGNHKFSCKYNCFRHYQICCEECEKDTCKNRCDGKSRTCGNVVEGESHD